MLIFSDFGWANLIGANLFGAHLRGADLSLADLANNKFDEQTNFAGAHLVDAIFESDEQKQTILKLVGVNAETPLLSDGSEKIDEDAI